VESDGFVAVVDRWLLTGGLAAVGLVLVAAALAATGLVMAGLLTAGLLTAGLLPAVEVEDDECFETSAGFSTGADLWADCVLEEETALLDGSVASLEASVEEADRLMAMETGARAG
jgi:hypothetical protein